MPTKQLAEQPMEPGTIEQWKPIRGFTGLYEVSDLGRVRSLSRLTRIHNGFRQHTGRILKPALDKDNYLYIGLHKNGVQTTCLVHRLVGRAFLSNPEHKPRINHIKSNETWNNRVSNLEWATAQEDADWRVAQNRQAHVRVRGSKNGHANLTEAEVKQMRRLRSSGLSTYALARMFGTARSNVSMIVRGKGWVHVK